MAEEQFSRDELAIVAIMEAYKPHLQIATEIADNKIELWQGILMGFSGIATGYVGQPAAIRMLEAVIEMIKKRPPDVSTSTH